MSSCNTITLCDPNTMEQVLITEPGVGYVNGIPYTGDYAALVKCECPEVGEAVITDNNDNTITIDAVDVAGNATSGTALSTVLVNDGGIGVSRNIDPDSDVLLHDANVSPMDFPSCDTVADANDLVMKNPDDGLLWVRNAGVKTVFGGARAVPIQDINTYTVGQEVALEAPNCRELPAHPDQTMQYLYHSNHMTTAYVLQPGWVIKVDVQNQFDGGAWGTLQAIRIDTRNNTSVEMADVVQNDETGIATVLKCSPREICTRIRITVEVAGNPGINTIRPRGSRIVAIGGTLV